MSFAPTLTHESQTVPGVRFTVHRMGFGRRTDLDMRTLSYRQKMRELEVDYPPQSEAEQAAAEALEIAQQKAMAVPADQFDTVLERDVKPLARELAAACASAEVRKRRALMDLEYAVIEAQLRRVWIHDGLVAISGGEVDGMTADELLDHGPPALALEIYEALASDGKLSPAQAKNSQSPGTSGAVAGEGRPNSSAPAAAPLPAATT